MYSPDVIQRYISLFEDSLDKLAEQYDVAPEESPSLGGEEELDASER